MYVTYVGVCLFLPITCMHTSFDSTVSILSNIIIYYLNNMRWKAANKETMTGREENKIAATGFAGIFQFNQILNIKVCSYVPLCECIIEEREKNIVP